MNTMSGRRRPSSTRASPELVSTMMRVAASRGRSARTLAAAASDADLTPSPVMLIPYPGPGQRPSPPARASSLRRNCSTGTRVPGTHEGALAPALARFAAEPGRGREHFEAQRASRRNGLDQPHTHGVAKPIASAAAIADQGVQVFAMAIVVFPD